MFKDEDDFMVNNLKPQNLGGIITTQSRPQTNYKSNNVSTSVNNIT